MMDAFWLISFAVLWAVVLLLGFLLLGTLRALGVLTWRLDQLQAITPSRVGRGGLKPGKKAPDFTLPAVAGGEASLHDFAGRKVFLVFVQGGCSPCHRVVPELNKQQRKGEVAVLAVFNGQAEGAAKWAAETKAAFPVLAQQQFAVSKRYEVFATPFAFLIDEQGVVRSTGIVNSAQHVGYVLSGRGAAEKDEPAAAEGNGAEGGKAEQSASLNSQKEVSHV
jgi:methylamine dehydrogenase accessory protein MauD